MKVVHHHDHTIKHGNYWHKDRFWARMYAFYCTRSPLVPETGFL
ncbi:hypothetical protein [Planktothricoides raciborskii]|uniref:Uncharacterized protein n=1 Tax=Planktothricoides raciborskii GIHE-MW2 TaxID=2792601 RepID=A0AAU8JJP9_9CYAN